jgi:hypothetical protein
MRTKLTFIYDAEMRPVAAKCTRCDRLMLPPPSTLHDAADIVMWLSQRFLEHKRLKHPTALDPDAADATEPDPPQEQ